MASYVFSSSEYRLSHRKEPRGTGNWWFRCNGVQYNVPHSMSLSEAKRWIAKELRQERVSKFVTIYVMP